jgi:hypothetical protein
MNLFYPKLKPNQPINIPAFVVNMVIYFETDR